ncbi:MAG: homoserine kinase type II [Oceanospirillaceae bacterium]|jgi:homoserine kinase type II
MIFNNQLDKQQVQQIFTAYDVSPVAAFKLLSGGSENTNFWVKTDTAEYVLTICEQKSIDECAQLANLLDYLQAHHFVTSGAVRTLDGRKTSLWCDKPVIVKTFISGVILQDISISLLPGLGNNLASLHAIKAPNYLPDVVGFGRQNFDFVNQYAADSVFNHWLQASAVYIDKFVSGDLPKTLIHSDIFADNIIIDTATQQATIMDFEEASYYYRIFDIGMMLIGCCCFDQQLSLTKATSLLQGYQQKIPLQDNEIAALQAFTVYAATATAFWRHQNYHYVNPTPDMSEHHLAMTELADNVRQISAADFSKIFD